MLSGALAPLYFYRFPIIARVLSAAQHSVPHEGLVFVVHSECERNHDQGLRYRLVSPPTSPLIARASHLTTPSSRPGQYPIITMSTQNIEGGINSSVDLATIKAALDVILPSPTTMKALLDTGASPDGTICRAKVEARIIELENEARALKSCLNTATATGRLPAEVLSHIFLELSMMGPTSDSTKQQLSWIDTTHVCRHWRAVALNCPALWANITIAHKNWTGLMLSRSKEAPLSVDLDSAKTRCGTKKFKELLDNILSHAVRLRSLKLCNVSADMISNFPRIIPNLQALVLIRSTPTYSTSVALPVHILAEGAPVLERLEVGGFTLPWQNLPSAPKLTSLKPIQSGGGGRLSPETLAESIGRMPSLQAFDLRNLLPLGPVHPISVEFPSLGPLTLVDQPTAVYNLLQSCNAFQAETIDIELTGAPSPAETVGNIFASLAARWRNPTTGAGQGIRALHLKGMDEDDPKKLHIEAHYRAYDPKERLKPDLRISIPMENGSAPKVLSLFAGSFEISTIQWLTVGLRSHHLRKSWQYIATLGNLETLLFSGGDAILGFISAMDDKWARPFFNPKSRRSAGSNRSRKKLLLPALSMIKCQDVDFDLDREGVAEENIMDLAMLLKRWPSVHPLRELHLNFCVNFTSSDYDCLQEEAPEFTIKWDGVEDVPSELDDDDEDMYDEFMMYHEAFEDYGYDSDYF